MKIFFYAGLISLIIFELASIYFIMPLPGSQRIPSLEAAYFIHRWRVSFWVGCGLLIALGIIPAFSEYGKKWVPILASLVTIALVTWIHLKMNAQALFQEPQQVQLAPGSQNKVNPKRLVVGVVMGKEARAYPIQFLAYHHQVRDTVAGTPILVTYCSVCRTGRVYGSLVDGEPETFRLVGMDHFNALFEDSRTHSWWRQVNGEAVVGSLKGSYLPDVPSRQTTLEEWLKLYPNSLVFQGDPAFTEEYSKDMAYENGTSESELTGTDKHSWHEKSWIVGIDAGRTSKAYDWNRLKQQRIINDVVGDVPVLVVLAKDNASFFAYQRPDVSTIYALKNDSLITVGHSYDLAGRSSEGRLRPINASQEFWHSWSTFHPKTERY
ncbi:DUF3179 domain-containing (seleno)protein [Siphonobacter curvatus]|uniref:DUF3179 domain-containing protein n=1 Tax=Siphonobacter curvatus TaxID=2094562 RepID=A0A2S7ISV4_9BACT|nr:DUF3179 domain-containing (seleno)protein [Siphonobacter curvatus]PQA60784.1 hypothetical protein C5O19_14565 [Siphonobacter curvatus]